MARSPSFSQNTENEALRSKTGGQRVDQFRERQDAVAADESLRLHSEGDEGEKGYEPKQAKEQERDQFVARRLMAPSPQHEAGPVEGRAALGDKGISAF
jgi:hypothetical protein